MEYEDIETALKKIYNNRKDKVNNSFQLWFNEQIERAEGELENQWKQ